MPRELTNGPPWWTRSIWGRSLHEQRRALIGWSLGSAATVFLQLALYPTVRNNDMTQLLDSYPESVKQLFGLTDYATGTGYVRAELFSFVLPLLLVILGILWGSDAIAGEEDRRTLDLLLANPVSRRRVVTEKCLAVLAGVGIVGAAMMASLLVGNAVFSVDVAAARLTAAMFMTIVLAAVFATLALTLGAATGRRGVSRGVAAAVAVASYMLSALAPLATWLDPWRPASPWYHALGVDPLGTGLPVWHMVLLLVVGGSTLAIAVTTFERRDLAV